MKINASIRSRLRKKLIQEMRSPQNREVIVKSAHPMSDGDLKKIQAAMPGLESAVIKHHVDENVIGGVVIIDGSKIIDYSVKGRLDELVTSLLAS